MTLKANVRLYGPTEPISGNGVGLVDAHTFGKIGDADTADDGEIWAYFDIDNAIRGDIEHQSSSLDLKGNRADFRALASEIDHFIEVNTVCTFVTALNDDGDERTEYGWGFTTEEAVEDALRIIRDRSGDESYVMNEWRAA
jgi:hypothetical protein